MERSFPPEGDPLFCHGCEEVVVIANATGSGQVHILDSKGTQSLLQFDNGSLPVFEEGAVISLWNHEEKIVGSGMRVFLVDLKGPCRWVWRSTRGKHDEIKPHFGDFRA